MKIKKETIQFNIQALTGELGALAGTPTFSYATSYFTSDTSIISAMAVSGGIIGSSLFFLLMRFYHKKKSNKFSEKSFVIDMAYFTPVAFILALILYYPTVFFLSRDLQASHSVLFSVLVAQGVAFTIILIALNIYRKILSKHTGRVL